MKRVNLIVHLIQLTLIAFLETISCDFTHGLEPEDFSMAIINVSYIDPITGRLHTQREEFGKYFNIGRIDPVSGLVVHITGPDGGSHDACDSIDPTTWPSEKWIALAVYGNCSEEEKLRNIAATNASAAVIYDNKLGNRYIQLHPKEPKLTSVFISKEKGEEIGLLIKNGTRVMLHITIATHGNFRYSNINKTSVLFVSISFAILMIISLAWLIFYYVQRFRYIHAKDILARRLCNAAKKALEKIPTKTVIQADLANAMQGDFPECCAVCIEPFKINDVVRILPCKHVFHKSCIDPWLLDQRSCPMCKLDILKHYGLMVVMASVTNLEWIEEQG
ncbi:RING finger protein 150 [Tetranychus urticae]|uniref:RING-type domain-containing protein n=1 Tax=Tetranychus urticae TaxID=32264 RepID=T1KW70_TETUR|nr:RING finger protein 150 [Tetranychus urticae]